MAISIATDLILDVVRAADPAIAGKTEAMLEMAAARKTEKTARTPEFARQVSSAGPAEEGLAAKLQPEPLGKSAVPESYMRFEAMVLQSFVQSMLPADSEEFFGKGTAGDIWRGMMAEQLGTVLAKGGGIGIAERLFDQQARPDASPEALGDATNHAANMISEIQMSILSDLIDTGGQVETPGVDEARA